jgi:hypothetical protein
MAWLIGKDRTKSVRKGLIAEGFWKSRSVTEPGWESRRSISGCEDERDATGAQDICNRVDHRTIHVDIEDRSIKLGALCEFDGMSHLGGWPDNLTAEVMNHILDKHGNHSFVLNNEDAAPWFFTHACSRAK